MKDMRKQKMGPHLKSFSPKRNVGFNIYLCVDCAAGFICVTKPSKSVK
jgi:hypothetical protein